MDTFEDIWSKAEIDISAVPMEAMQGLLQALQRRAWVPVGVRLPEAHRIVLCCHQEAPDVQWFGSHWPDGWYTPTGRATDPTHWQPLPAGLDLEAL